MVTKGWTADKEAAGGLTAAASTGDIKMTDHLRLENEAGTKGRQSEQVARSFMNCPDNCPWVGRCLNGTKFDDGKGGLKPSSFAPWIDFSHYSPCFLIRTKPIRGNDNVE